MSDCIEQLRQSVQMISEELAILKKAQDNDRDSYRRGFVDGRKVALGEMLAFCNRKKGDVK